MPPFGRCPGGLGRNAAFCLAPQTASPTPPIKNPKGNIENGLFIMTHNVPERSQNAPGYPNRLADLNALPGFRNPPPGYGEVPFWWWSGDDLDVDRLLWQVRELHKKGISGFQVNYSHHDTPGWLTDTGEPGFFTEAWWTVYSRISEECAKLGMGIGLSTYTIDWPNGSKNLFYELFYSKPELNAIELVAGERQRLFSGQTKTFLCADGQFSARAYPVINGVIQQGGIDLTSLAKNGEISWTAPDGEWEIWVFAAAPQAGSINPLLVGSGDTVIRDFFQKFEDHNPGKSAKGLNFFFNDELQIGVGKYAAHGKFAWNHDFLGEFRKQKGYDLFEVLPAMWEDMGDITPKVRMDYADVRMTLMEERYFKPIYEWHHSRGLIFGCDTGGRGMEPDEFGDYFRVTRWYTAPGHDTPGGNADPIKGKISSSIANLYQQPRVWLEGYHSLGWGATPERLMFATNENYLYGCSLLSLHGLYYSTNGSHWEWAPPCYHFRMPYWEHMGSFLVYFERLSYLFSQGHTVADVAVIYPVAPYEAEMNGQAAREVAFDLGRRLLEAGISFEFIDNDSLARATVADGRLRVDACGASYQALVFPNMSAARWPSIQKAADFAAVGGKVYAVGCLPTVSDRAGRNDPVLASLNERIFPPSRQMADPAEAVLALGQSFVQDVHGLRAPVRSLHRKVGFREVYLVMDAKPGDVAEFRAKGRVELWDPWTGNVQPLRVVQETVTGTQVELPLEAFEAQVVVFSPGSPHENPPIPKVEQRVTKTLPGEWEVRFVPTMNNRYGDFRLPVTAENKIIGVEARRFAWSRETPEMAATAMLPGTDDTSWKTQLHGYGPQFYLLGPIPELIDPAKLDAELAKLQRIDPAVPVILGDLTLHWQLYEFSWRYGKEGDPGHQGYHGLKGTITDHFIRLGKADYKGYGLTVLTPEVHTRYYLWTSATVGAPTSATVHVSDAAPADMPNTSPVVTPSAVFINGSRLDDLAQPVSLKDGVNPVLLRYNNWGESHFVLRHANTPQPENRPKLGMRWSNDSGVIHFDPYAGEPSAEWFRFLSAPGTTAICLNTASQGEVQAWIGGEPMIDKGNGRYEAQNSTAHAAVVALRLLPDNRLCGGSAIPEPISVETGRAGVIPLGDWSALGILHNYSGGVRYRSTFTLTEQEAEGSVELDLGRATATAEATINGKKIGVRVAPPWTFDTTGSLRAGENEIEVLVFNTLANHYQTIPSCYRGEPASGMFGPVRLRSSNPQRSAGTGRGDTASSTPCC